MRIKQTPISGGGSVLFGESNKNKPVSLYPFEVVGTVEEDKGGKVGRRKWE